MGQPPHSRRAWRSEWLPKLALRGREMTAGLEPRLAGTSEALAVKTLSILWSRGEGRVGQLNLGTSLLNSQLSATVVSFAFLTSHRS